MEFAQQIISEYYPHTQTVEGHVFVRGDHVPTVGYYDKVNPTLIYCGRSSSWWPQDYDAKQLNCLNKLLTGRVIWWDWLALEAKPTSNGLFLPVFETEEDRIIFSLFLQIHYAPTQYIMSWDIARKLDNA